MLPLARCSDYPDPSRAKQGRRQFFSCAATTRSLWIAGNVKDQNGAPIEGVLLTLGTEEQVTAATSSREDGAFLFEEMPFGSYTLSISYPSAADESSDRPTMIAVGNSTAVSDLRITLVQSTTEIEDAKSLPIAFALEQNYPIRSILPRRSVSHCRLPPK